MGFPAKHWAMSLKEVGKNPIILTKWINKNIIYLFT